LSFETRNRLRQNFLAILVGILSLSFTTRYFYVIKLKSAAATALLALFFYGFCLLVASFLISLIAFRKDGYLIVCVLTALMILGDFLYIILSFYGNETSLNQEVTRGEFLSVIKFFPGMLLVVIGSFLGVFTKYKKQKGMNFKLILIEKLR